MNAADVLDLPTPSETDAIPSASNANGGTFHRGPLGQGSSKKETERAIGTVTASITRSLLPVPRMPSTSQLSTIRTSSAGAKHMRICGSPRSSVTASPSASTSIAPPSSHEQFAEPLPHSQRPVTSRTAPPAGYEPSDRTARPVGA